jgi:deoxyribodipyrimidine photo-lyase
MTANLSQTPILVWLRQDLRLGDQPALTYAANSGRPVIPVYVFDTDPDQRPMGGASRWWLNRSLTSLNKDLARIGSNLILRRGKAAEVITTLIEEAGAEAIAWNRLYEPAAIARDAKLKAALKDQGLEVKSFNGALLNEPWTVETGSGGPYKVFTPYWRAAKAKLTTVTALPAPKTLIAPANWPASEQIEDWGLHPSKPDWSKGFAEWQPGEAGAKSRLQAFLEGPANAYAEGRDQPGKVGTSRLSPHLHFGEISPRQVWLAAQMASHKGDLDDGARDKFLAEIGWREFNHHLLFHFPDIATENFKPGFDGFGWLNDAKGLKAWQKGLTGYPMVDAGMRELWATGWMHNRVRMIVASFLVKHLLIHWREGEAWFWDTLLDADLANNAAGWQWTAGTGADASPYFRIFNPISQGEKFDPKGDYIRRWIPELASLPNKLIHRPWEASALELAAAGISLGTTYPNPMIDHSLARGRALEAYGLLKTMSSDEAA